MAPGSLSPDCGRYPVFGKVGRPADDTLVTRLPEEVLEPSGKALTQAQSDRMPDDYYTIRRAGWVEFIVERRWVAVSLDCRLATRPYPASVGDVLTAMQWIKGTDREEPAVRDRCRIALLRGSAHLG